MELIFNELSCYPLAADGRIAEQRFRQVLTTFRQAKEQYGFKHIMFPGGFSSLQVTPNGTFSQWIPSVRDHSLKNLVIGLCRRPYYDELTESETESFFESEYTVAERNSLPAEVVAEQPVGLALAYIKSVPAMSLDSHEFWQTRRIGIQRVFDDLPSGVSVFVYNICVEQDLQSEEFQEWHRGRFAKRIVDELTLRTYLSYTRYKVTFEPNFVSEVLDWRDSDSARFERLLELMKDVELHPFTGGLGKTEVLAGRNKEASKRLTDGDRLSYRLEEGTIAFIACKGHYNFH